MASGSFKKVLFFAVASAAIVAAIVFDPKGLRRYGRLRADAQALENRNEELQLENGRLAREIDALQHDRRYQERAAREELGFIRPGQILLELDEPRATPVAPALAGGLP